MYVVVSRLWSKKVSSDVLPPEEHVTQVWNVVENAKKASVALEVAVKRWICDESGKNNFIDALNDGKQLTPTSYPVGSYVAKWKSPSIALYKIMELECKGYIYNAKRIEVVPIGCFELLEMSTDGLSLEHVDPFPNTTSGTKRDTTGDVSAKRFADVLVQLREKLAARSDKLDKIKRDKEDLNAKHFSDVLIQLREKVDEIKGI
jgi:hypothetical protein